MIHLLSRFRFVIEMQNGENIQIKTNYSFDENSRTRKTKWRSSLYDIKTIEECDFVTPYSCDFKLYKCGWNCINLKIEDFSDLSVWRICYLRHTWIHDLVVK